MDIKITPTVDLSMGAIAERLEDAMAEVIKNIKDVNTEAEAVRKIVLTIKIAPGQNRQACQYKIGCDLKLASPKDVDGIMYVAIRGEEPVLYERNPDQASLNFNGPDEVINQTNRED